MLMVGCVICQVKGGETLDGSDCYSPFLNHLPFSIVCQQTSLFEGLFMGLVIDHYI